jgi:polyhydroxyalkanoate synthesis regulator protein
MSGKTKTSVTAMVACLGVLLAVTAMAQSPPAATTQDGMSVHHQRLYKIMKDMTQEMTGMTELMSRSNLTPDQRKQMAQRMELMSGMMRRMSGFAAMPAMMDPEQQKQMDEMRKQMDEMMGSSAMKPGPK